MSKDEHKNEIIKNLKEIIKTSQNNIDAFYDDDFCVYLLSSESLDNSMNYIRLLTNKVQFSMINYKNSK